MQPFESADPLMLLAWEASLIACAAFMLRRYVIDKSLKSEIELTPTSRIRSLAMGPVEVKGVIAANKNDLVKSPFKRVDCVYCDWKIERYGMAGGQGITIDEGKASRYFFLHDETGYVLIDPEGAWFKPPLRYEFLVGRDHNPKEPVRQFLESNKIPYRRGEALTDIYRFTESYFRVGETAYVLGYAGKNPFMGDAAHERNEQGIMIQKGKLDFYVISKTWEPELLRRYEASMRICIAGAALFVSIGLFLALASLGVF